MLRFYDGSAATIRVVPFTPSHAVAVLPVVRSRLLDPTCLVIGSMAPDFEYFVRGRLGGVVGHSLIGLVVWCLPMTLIVAALYHAVVKWPLLLIAPAWIRARTVATVGAPWRARSTIGPRGRASAPPDGRAVRWSVAAVASCAVSAMFGGLTHLVWDSFTHTTGWGVRHVAVLRTEVPFPILGTDTLARALQHTSSIAGLVILGVLGVLALRRQPPVGERLREGEGPSESTHPVEPTPDGQTRARWIFAVALVGAAALLVVRVLHARRSYEIGDLVVAPISGVLAGSIIASVLVSRDARRFARMVRSAR